MTTATRNRSHNKGRTNRRTSRTGSGRRDRPSWLLRITVAAVAVAALAAVTVALLAGGDTTETAAFDRAGATVAGETLSPLPDAGDDPAVGQPAPLVEGQDRQGEAVEAPVAGRPTVLLFVAHWCPHCQREVPAVQDWINAGEMPSGVDVVAVSTALDPARPNYPPSAWLDREQWTLPTIADADGSAATAYGLSAFPFWVAVDAQGMVVDRRVGELTLDQLHDLAATAT
jgi:cytochrome c biogenesis protein CcmG, thiol:disulfide interchange protein DsbE